MAERPKRRRLNPETDPDPDNQGAAKHFPNDPLQALTGSEKNQWPGFCEIESEPVWQHHNCLI